MNNYYNRPAPTPLGASQIGIWQRQTQAQNAQNLLRSVKGGKLKSDPNGGYHLVIDKPKTKTPQIPVVNVPVAPFTIYKPDIGSLWQLDAILLVNNPTNPDLQTSVEVTSSQPTNLPGTKGYNPDTFNSINPNTDAWRIWAVRDGFVNERPYLEAIFEDQEVQPGWNGTFMNVPMQDYSQSEPAGINGDAGTDMYGYDLDPDQTGGGIQAIILPGNPDADGLYSFALWLVIGGGYFVNGQQYATFTTTLGLPSQDEAFPNANANIGYGSARFAPLGVITSVPPIEQDAVQTVLYPYQIQYGNPIVQCGFYINSYDNGLGADNPMLLSASVNYRGDWANDFDINSLLFYPGDVVKIETQISLIATGGGGIAVTFQSGATNSAVLYGQQLWMMTTVGFTDNPASDANWVQISGINIASQAGKTPNTGA